MKVRQPLYINQPPTDFFLGELKSFDFMEGCTLGSMIAPQRASQIKYNDSFYMYIYNQNSPQKETLYKSVRLQVATIAINIGLNTWLDWQPQLFLWMRGYHLPHHSARLFLTDPNQKLNRSMVFFTELLFNSPFLTDPGKPLKIWTTSKVWSGPHKIQPNSQAFCGPFWTGTLQGENQATFKAAGSFSTTSSRLLSACPASSST